MEETASPAAVLQTLHALGVQLLLDDFGTGYSSLNYVKRFPLHGLKVDRSFIAGLPDDESDRAMLRAILSMAAALDIAVLAEGVETLEQAAWLASVDCEYAQGFGLARPAPAEVIEPLLRDGLPAERIGWSLDGASPPPPPSSEPESTVPLSEAAEALGISASTLRRWADTGKLQTIRTPGGHRRFPVSEVRRLSSRSGAHTRGAVQSTELPHRPVVAFAELLELGPGAIVVAASSIYSRGRPGWFGSPAGSVALADWVAALAQAARDGAYDRAVESTRRLLTLADFAGTSLLERHWSLERIRDTCLRQLRDGGARASRPGRGAAALPSPQPLRARRPRGWLTFSRPRRGGAARSSTAGRGTRRRAASRTAAGA